MTSRREKVALRGMVCDDSGPKLHTLNDSIVSVSNYHADLLQFLQLS